MISLRTTAAKALINGMESTFERHGIPDVVVSANGPQYSSDEFQRFAQDWDFNHITSSPYHPQSNGLAESAVKTVKNLLEKSTDSGQNFYKALLAYRATPLENGHSLAKLLMRRNIKTTLPINTSVKYCRI